LRTPRGDEAAEAREAGEVGILSVIASDRSASGKLVSEVMAGRGDVAARPSVVLGAHYLARFFAHDRSLLRTEYTKLEVCSPETTTPTTDDEYRSRAARGGPRGTRPRRLQRREARELSAPVSP
jgi:hypothetical protein